MSLSLVKVPVKKVLCPEIDINKEKVYVVAQGAKSNTYQRFQAQNLNTSSITVTHNPPSRETVINRKAYVHAKFKLTITGTAGSGGLMVQPGLDAPKAWPIARACNSVSISLNNDVYPNVINQYWLPMTRYHDPKKLVAGRYSETPSYLDQYQEFNDFNITQSVGGAAKNSLGSYGANSEDLRGGFSGFTIESDAANVAVVHIDSTEPILNSPFVIDDNEELDGFVGIQNMQSVWSFSELSSALWSHNNVAAGHSTIASIAVEIESFEILLNFQSLPMDVPLNNTPIYDFFEIVPYSTPAVSLASGASTTITMNSVQLKTIPRRMYIFAAENSNDMLFSNGGCNKTDTYAAITGINITFNNKTGILSNMSQQNLYQLCVENGCNLSWNQFSKYTGSVVALDFSKDLSLDDNLASGIIGNFQLGMNVSITNPKSYCVAPSASRTVNYVLWVVVVNEGVAQIMNGSMSHQVGVFNRQDVLTAPIDHKITFKKAQHVYGGDIYKAISGIYKKVMPIVDKICRNKPVVEQLAEDFTGDGVLMPRGGKMASRSKLKSRLY